MRVSLILLFATMLGLSLATRPAASVAPRAAKVDFALHDYRGPIRSLGEFAEKPVVVLAFLGTECPVAEKYATRLAELAKEFEIVGVQFVGINSNRQDSLSDIREQVERSGIGFPVLKDPDHVVADLFDARRTPEIVVLDAARRVRYRGRVDDQFAAGVIRPAPTRPDLKIAISQLLRGALVTTPETEVAGCLIGRTRRAEPNGDVTYSNQIARIFERRCVECHREGEIGPFSMDSYDEIVGWADMIQEVVDEGRMPPWFADSKHHEFTNDNRLTDEERDLIRAWVAGGAPEGNPADLPARRKFPDGWSIPAPDLVLNMSDKPFQVPATGAVEYQYFDVPTGLTEDKWLQAAEVRPGSPSLIHHITVVIVPPGEGKRPYGLLTGRIPRGPGTPARIFPPGTAMHVPAGATIQFQIHYTPDGRPHEDMSSFGMKFADPKTVKHQVWCGVAFNTKFLIPPGHNNYKVEADQRIEEDSYLFELGPHMHLRGKAFRVEAHFPDGRKELLLNMPKFDFNWMQGFFLKEPKFLPKGTVVHCEGWFDNSKENPSNPDPSRWVPWGDQIWDEMLSGHYSVYLAKEIKSDAG